MTEKIRLTVAIFISVVISLGISLGYIYFNEKKWCDLFVLLDEGYNAPVQPGQPPLNERGQRIADRIHDRRISLGCD